MKPKEYYFNTKRKIVGIFIIYLFVFHKYFVTYLLMTVWRIQETDCSNKAFDFSRLRIHIKLLLSHGKLSTYSEKDSRSRFIYIYIYIYMAWNNGRQHFRGSECHIFKVTYFVTEPTFCILLGILQLFLKILVSAPSTKCILTRYGLSMAPFYGPKVSTFFHQNVIVFGQFFNKKSFKCDFFCVTTI